MSTYYDSEVKANGAFTVNMTTKGLLTVSSPSIATTGEMLFSSSLTVEDETTMLMDELHTTPASEMDFDTPYQLSKR